MLHPHARLDGIFPEQLGTWGSGEKAGLISLEFYASAGRYSFDRGFKLQLSPGPGPAALATGAVKGTPLSWGAAHHQAFESLFDKVVGLTVCIEDLPEIENRVALSRDIYDADGDPSPQIIYALSENSRHSLSFGLERSNDVLKAAGATATFCEKLRTQAGFHIMGTARMGNDPSASVVDPWGRCHDIENLFIGDASVFVTSGCLNPTSTAQAFALRLADHLVATSNWPKMIRGTTRVEDTHRSVSPPDPELSALFDTLVPGSPSGWPSASEALTNLATVMSSLSLDEQADIKAWAVGLSSTAEETWQDFLRRCEENHPQLFERLLKQLYWAYYSSPAVQHSLRRIAEAGPYEESPYVDLKLVGPVLANRRGQRRLWCPTIERTLLRHSAQKTFGLDRAITTLPGRETFYFSRVRSAATGTAI
jgi:GMC oxidoreductase